jgi:hypothetical protein
MPNTLNSNKEDENKVKFQTKNERYSNTSFMPTSSPFCTSIPVQIKAISDIH